MGYTLPFTAPQRIAGPGSFKGPDVSLSQYFPQNVIFTKGGLTRYAFLVNGFQAAAGSTDFNERWPLAGGAPPYKCYVHVRKSSDGGATWADAGTPQAKEIPPQNSNDSFTNPTTIGYLSVSCWLDGNRILVLRPVWDFTNYSNTQPHNLVISVWNLLIDDWGPDLSTAAAPNAPVLANGNFFDQWTAGAAPFFIARRPSDGHIFALYKQTEFVDTRTSGNDLRIVNAGTPASGNDLHIISVAGNVALVDSASHVFQPTEAGLTLFIEATGTPAGFNPGAYLIQAVSGGQAQLLGNQQGVAGAPGAIGARWDIIGANKVSSASHGPYTAADLNYGLGITGGAGFIPGNYIIAGIDGSGNAILSQNCGVAGSVGGSWTQSRQFTFGQFDRCLLSEFDGAAWLPAVPNVFGQNGVIQNFTPVGLELGDGSRLHLFCEQSYENLLVPPPTDFKYRNILIRTLTAAGALQTIQTVFETDASNGSAASYFVNTPRTRPAGGRTELLLSWVYTNARTQSLAVPLALNLTRFLSDDVPVIITETISTGRANGHTADAWNADQSSPDWCPGVNLTTGDLYLVTMKPCNGPPIADPLEDINVFTDNAGWDGGASVFHDPGSTQSLGALTANSLPGFIGMALSWNTDAVHTGDIPWGDPWYFELDFAASGLSIICDNPPAGVVGSAYSHLFPASGGALPYGFSIVAGALPPGLSLDASRGLVYGSPTLAGVFAFTVQVADATGATAAVACSISISNPPSPAPYWNPGNASTLVCEKHYPWIIPPVDRKPVFQKGTIAAPAAGVLTELWAYEVPDGVWLVMDRLAIVAAVAGFIPGSGGILFTLDINSPISDPLLTSRPLAQFTTPLGDLSEPVAVGPVQLYSGDVLRAKVLVMDNTLGVGPPNFIQMAALGWLFPHSRIL